MSRWTSAYPTIRELSNVNTAGAPPADKPIVTRTHSIPPPPPTFGEPPALSLSSIRLSSRSSSPSKAGGASGGGRRRSSNRAEAEMYTDIDDMFAHRERATPRPPPYLTTQVEINEKMRMILIDWLVDVHLKFHLHAETLFLAVDVLDRYLALSRTPRQTLQLVGVTAMWIAAKYEEIIPPLVNDCVNLSANTYTREEVLKMERTICTALNFKLTTPTPYPFLLRLLRGIEADEQLKQTAMYFLEHALLDYKQLQFLPSQVACAALYLANITLRREAWGATLQQLSRAAVESFRPCAVTLSQTVAFVATTKYVAVRRKYSSVLGDVIHRPLVDIPLE